MVKKGSPEKSAPDSGVAQAAIVKLPRRGAAKATQQRRGLNVRRPNNYFVPFNGWYRDFMLQHGRKPISEEMDL